MKKKLIAFFALCLFPLFSKAYGTFLPDEDILSPDELPTGVSNMDKREFEEIIKRIKEIYSPIVSSHGGNLSITGRWDSEEPNARASQLGGAWRVEITGGLARRPELTPDGFSLILCHELGHHLGGFSFANPLPIPIPVPTPDSWAANEGQADYYATHVCSRNIWQDQQDINRQFRESASEDIKRRCDQVWRTAPDQDLCYRTLVATDSMILTMATLKGVDLPSFDTPDTSTVGATIDKHPAVQCRMDTSLQGTLCTAEFNETLIPGKTADGGVDGIEAEREGLENSCSSYQGYEVGLRPRCWFKNRL